MPKLFHEVRQPLSAIESAAFCLEMALESADEDLRQQCRRLRSMVSQASWLLDDASLDYALPASGDLRSSLNEEIHIIAGDLALHEETPIDLSLAVGQLPVALPAARLRRIVSHVLCFLLDVAQAGPEVSARTFPGEGWSGLAISARIGEQRSAEMVRLFTSLWPGGLAAAVEGAGGGITVGQSDGVMEIQLRFPAASDN